MREVAWTLISCANMSAGQRRPWSGSYQMSLTILGYRGAAGSAEYMARSGDNGRDGVIRQDPLGLDQICVQAKRYAAGIQSIGRRSRVSRAACMTLA